MSANPTLRIRRGIVALLALLPLGAAVAEESAQGVIRLDETVISGNQELPKVLYILPWRDPNGLPEIELDTRYSEMEVFRRLYPPAYRRELTYFQSLENDTANTEE